MAGKANFVRDDNGVEVHGLSVTVNRKTGRKRYYTDLLGKAKRHWHCQDDEQQAIFLHRQFAAKLKRHQIHFSDAKFVNSGPDESLVRELMGPLTDGKGSVLRILPRREKDGTIIYSVPEAVVFKQLREMILQDPQEAARRLGIPQIAHLEKLEPPPPSMTLDEALGLYLTKHIGSATRYRAKAAWKEFQAITGVDDMAGISKQDVLRWADSIRSNDHAAATVRGKVIQVRTIVKHAATFGDDETHCERVRSLLRKLVAVPKTAAPDPKPIERDDFHALLETADIRWRAILLTALNCAYYPIDIRFVPKSALVEGMVVYERTKTPGVPRVALLWDRTVEAIDRYRSEMPHDGETVFVSEIGRPYGNVSFWQKYTRIARAAGVASTFGSLRDGALTWGLRLSGNQPAVTVLAGHELPSVLDPYVLRDPAFVRPPSEAIERHYFG